MHQLSEHPTEQRLANSISKQKEVISFNYKHVNRNSIILMWSYILVYTAPKCNHGINCRLYNRDASFYSAEGNKQYHLKRPNHATDQLPSAPPDSKIISNKSMKATFMLLNVNTYTQGEK